MPNENVNKVILGTETLLDLTEDTVQAADVAAGKSFHLASGARTTGTASYAGAPTNNGNANATNAILYGAVDSTSTSTAYTATVAGLDQLVDGTCVMLHNGVVTSAAGFTVNINDLGAKKCYNNMTNATQDTTIFNVAYTMLFVYAEDLDEGNGGWWIYRGYDGNTNTIGYQLRTNSGNKVASDTGYRYRLWFTSADGSKWVPANTSTSTSATGNRSLNTRAIDPFGPIVYRATNGTCTSGSGLGATGIWQQYTLSIGYSYMASGFSLSFPDSVYLKCTPNADGSATMESIVQALPSSKDGKIYIHLGTAYSATSMELQTEHPVYWHDGTGIRIWTGSEGGGSSVEPATAAPIVDGTAAVGTSTKYAREDHVHPTDTSRQAALVSGTNIKTVNNESLLGSGNIAIGGSTTTWYGETATNAITSTKIVTCTGFELQTGAIISVLFTYGSSSSSMSLNVNSTGAITVYKGGDALSSTNYKNIAKNSVVTFIYSGTYWYVISESPFSSGVLFSDAGNMSSSSGNYTLNLTTSTSTNVSSPIDGLMLAVKFINDCPNVYKIKLNTGGTFSVYAYESPRGWAAVSSTFKLPAYADDLCFFVANNYSWYFLGRINQYTLPTASASTLGGVKVGSGLSIASDGTLSASGGSQSWTDITSQLTTTTFEGTVLTDGHLCVIISEQDGTTDDGSGKIIQGLPLPQDYVYFTASRNRVNIPLVVDTDGILKLSFPEESYPDETFDGFTIIYPVASS